MIIFNEKEYAKDLLEKEAINSVCYRDIKAICKYLKLCYGYDNQTIKEKVVELYKSHISNFAFGKYEQMFEKILKELDEISEYEQVNKISFSCEELSRISLINDLDKEKVVFTIMAVQKAKNYKGINIATNSSISLKELFDLAKVKASNEKREAITSELCRSGILDLGYGVSKNGKSFYITIKSKFLQNNNCVGISFIPNDDMVMEYLQYIGKAIKCQRCGKLVYKKNNKQKYCKDCAKSIKNEQNIGYYHNLGK